MLKWVASSLPFCLGIALAACGGDETPPSTTETLSSSADSDQDGIVDRCEGTLDTDSDGLPAWQDPDERISCGGATTGSSTPTTGEASGAASTTGAAAGGATSDTTSTTGSLSQPDGGGSLPSADDAGMDMDDAGRGPITGLRKPKVHCGATECEGTGIVCCETWTLDGITEPRCLPEAQCEVSAGPLASTNDMKSLCDGPEDCGIGTPDDPGVCCFYRQAAPHMGGLVGGVDYGPGFGRECTRLSTCRAGDVDLAAAGQPTGFVSCNVDDDCAVDSNKTCQLEAMSDPTAGNVAPRAHVRLCK